MTKIIHFKEDASSSDIHKAFEPLTVSFQVWGIYIPRDRKGVIRICQSLYTALVVMSALVDVARMGFIFSPDQNVNLDLLSITSLFLVEFALNYLLVSTVVVLSQHYEKLVDMLENYDEKFGFIIKPKLRKYIRCIHVLCLFMSLVPILMSGLLTWLFEGFDFYVPFSNFIGLSKWIPVVLLYISKFYVNIAWLQLFFMFLLITYCLGKEFDNVNERVREMLRTHCCVNELPDLKRQHSEICLIVSKGNAVFTHMIFANLAVGISVTCLMFYGIIRTNLDIQNTVTLAYCATSVILSYSLIILFAAFLNAKAHGCLDDLYVIDVRNQPPDIQHCVTQFLVRLIGPPIGYTVLGLFTVDASTILTVCGTLLTYLVVILQLNPNDISS